MLTQICQEINNWFERDKLYGDFVVSGGVLTYADGSALPILNGQYYRIRGSVFNDGVHKWGDQHDTLTAEPEFFGAVWPMAVPPDLVALAAEIDTWINDNGAALASPFQSESKSPGSYSYSLKSGAGADGGSGGITWQSQFASRMNAWRKI